jgi:hypothetical protein
MSDQLLTTDKEFAQMLENITKGVEVPDSIFRMECMFASGYPEVRSSVGILRMYSAANAGLKKDRHNHDVLYDFLNGNITMWSQPCGCDRFFNDPESWLKCLLSASVLGEEAKRALKYLEYHLHMYLLMCIEIPEQTLNKIRLKVAEYLPTDLREQARNVLYELWCLGDVTSRALYFESRPAIHPRSPRY